jgi:biofilm PGA synthesis N-glycosyltransferase PgaC
VSYVLITPARNEAQFLPEVIRSIAGQRIPPIRWVIVSDGSTDGTDAIVRLAAAQHAFIRLLRLESGELRSFGSKAAAFQKGWNEVKQLQFDFVGNLDADITLDPGYYQRIIHEMEADTRLGVASGVCWDKRADGFQCVTVSLNHAVGAVHFFRRECFETVGGYKPVTVGGMDSIAILTARMNGWTTRCFPDLPVYHHKPVDSASGRSAIRIAYRAGMTEYHIGTHPLFAVSKAVRRWKSSPVLLSAVVRLGAYLVLWLSRARRDAPPELTSYVYREQLLRMKVLLSKPPFLHLRSSRESPKS